jgi:hypothetical protein
MSNNNDRLQEHTDIKTGKTYFTTTDASGNHTPYVDAENVHLLRDTTWRVTIVCPAARNMDPRSASNSDPSIA